MQGKLPLSNRILRLLSALDPKERGHSLSAEYLKKLPKAMHINMEGKMDIYTQSISSLQLDSTLPVYTEGSRIVVGINM